MAYLAFDFEAAPTIASAPVEPDTRIAFSAREWQVIHLARGEKIARPTSRLVQWMHILFGLRVANPLADPRLEALREAAARLWPGADMLERPLIDRLRAHDFSMGQLTLLSGWIVTQRS